MFVYCVFVHALSSILMTGVDLYNIARYVFDIRYRKPRKMITSIHVIGLYIYLIIELIYGIWFLSRQQAAKAR